jgi:hypothetical protein
MDREGGMRGMVRRGAEKRVTGMDRMVSFDHKDGSRSSLWRGYHCGCTLNWMPDGCRLVEFRDWDEMLRMVERPVDDAVRHGVLNVVEARCGRG